MRNNRFPYYSDTSRFILKAGSVLLFAILLTVCAVDARADVSFEWTWPTKKTDGSVLPLNKIKEAVVWCSKTPEKPDSFEPFVTVIAPANKVALPDNKFTPERLSSCYVTAMDADGNLSAPSNKRSFMVRNKPVPVTKPSAPVLYIANTGTGMQLVVKANASAYFVDSWEDGKKYGKNAGPKENAVDGDPRTIWHTEWQSSKPPHPHEIQLDLGSVQSITGLTYQPRQGQGGGTIQGYEIRVSTDGMDWTTRVAKGRFSYTVETDLPEQTVLFPAVQARYISLIALSEINGLPITTAAEVGVLVVE